MKLLLLPGMDGTGRLFAPLLAVLPPSFEPIVVSYPGSVAFDWEELRIHVEKVIPTGESYVVLAESFSGPLALRIAANTVHKPRAVILCASFVRNPNPNLESVLRVLISMGCFRFPPSRFLIRRFLLGDDAPDDLVDSFYATLHEARPEVLAKRARMILGLNAEEVLKRCSVPLLYLRATRDRLVGGCCADGMQRLNTAMEIVDVDAPHFLVQRQPERVAKEVERFLGVADD